MIINNPCYAAITLQNKLIVARVRMIKTKKT